MTLSKAVSKYKQAHKAASSILAQSNAGLPDETAVNNLAAHIFGSGIEISDGGPSDHAGQDAGQEEALDQAYSQ